MTRLADATDIAFPCRRARPGKRLRVFCLPWAGAGASVFKDWDLALGPDVEVCAFQPPGRETRFGEVPVQRLETLVDQFLAASSPLREGPFVLLGHSFGAMVAAETALRLSGQPGAPAALVVLGCPAPSAAPRHAPIAHLPQPAFLRALQDLGGMDDAVVADDELVQLLLPGLRADCRMAEAWRSGAARRFHVPLSCQLAAMAGEEDPYVSVSELNAWAVHARAGARVWSVPGDHFFLRTTLEPVAQALHELALLALS